jgi:hypothetical protein
VAGVKAALKSELYKAILAPAIEKMKRVIAIQVAVPGNPSVYLPDFYGMTGGELAKNAFLARPSSAALRRSSTQR